jgi:hypothetical protein
MLKVPKQIVPPFALLVHTDLIGFNQTYWDANSLAIHNQISRTVFINQQEVNTKQQCKEVLENEKLSNHF